MIVFDHFAVCSIFCVSWPCCVVVILCRYVGDSDMLLKVPNFFFFFPSVNPEGC